MDGLLGGFSALMSPDLWALMLVGVVVGIIFGAIPGLSATMAIVLFLPITFSLNVYQAFTLLVALYIGGVSGGLISAQHSWLGYVHRHLLRRAPYGRERPCQARAGDRHCVLVPGDDIQPDHYDRCRTHPGGFCGRVKRL